MAVRDLMSTPPIFAYSDTPFWSVAQVAQQPASRLATNTICAPVVVVHPASDVTDARILMRQYRVHRLVAADEASDYSVGTTVRRLTASHGLTWALHLPCLKSPSLA